MDKIISAFEITLLDSTLSGACADILETGIDSLLNEGIFNSIPIVNVLVGTAKTAQNIHDRNLLRQTIKFINTFNAGTIDHTKLNKYRDKISNDSKKAEEELGRVIIILNNNIDVKKSELLAQFYKAYVFESINWEQFCELSDVISRLFISDLPLLFKVYTNEVHDTSHCITYQAERLISIGLLSSAIQSMTISSGNGSNTEKHIQINELSKMFCSFGMNR